MGYLTLHGLFTAHMTGNTTKLGIALGNTDLSAATPLVVVVALFIAGIGAGTLVVDSGRRWAVLLLQALLATAFMAYGSTVVTHGRAPDHDVSGFYMLAALATLALGVQTAALTHIHGTTVRTSYISGVLTNLAQAGARRLTRGRSEGGEPALLAGLSLCYLTGATAAAFGLDEAGVWCVAVPVTALVGAAGLDRWRDTRR